MPAGFQHHVLIVQLDSSIANRSLAHMQDGFSARINEAAQAAASCQAATGSCC